MEAQMAWQVMADMFDGDGSVLLASFDVLNMVKHSGVSKHELRFHGVHSSACCQTKATDKRLISKEKNILRDMIVTDLLPQYSEDHRVLSVLNSLPIRDQDLSRPRPSMKAQMAWQVMADMFDGDGGILLASFDVLNMVKHSGVSKHELRFHGVHS